MKVLDYIDQKRVLLLPTCSKEESLRKLVNLSSEFLTNQTLFYEAILEREELMSTGFGFEIAFPHSKNDSVVDLFITIGIAKQGINWNSFDGKPVKMIFLIGGLVEEQERYLKILAALSNLVKNDNYRKKLLNAENSLKFSEIFSKLALTENQAI